MKIILEPYKGEVAKYYCDKHYDSEAFNQVKITSWYGSKFDLNFFEIHLCDKCVEEVRKYLLENYGKTLAIKEI